MRATAAASSSPGGQGQEKPLATQFYLQQPDPFGHFIYLVKAIDFMMQTGHPPYPH